jgi:Fur family transcriptional regulator, ferric uptake regulator
MPANLAIPQALESSIAALRAKGARVTRTRLAVLGLLITSERALSHQEILTALVSERIGRITVYRVLDWLMTLGLAHKYIDSERTSRFTFGRQLGSLSASFGCRICRNVYPISIDHKWWIELPKGLRLEEAHVRLRGTCATCNTSRESGRLPP